MADYDYEKSFGRWLSVAISGSQTPTLSIALNTANFQERNVTGWPLQYGHLFIGVTDQTVVSALDGSTIVAFDLKIHTDPVTARPTAENYNGRRVLLGALGIWPEAAPRTNTVHFLEVDISQTPGYSESYHEPQYPLCRDVAYDRCFYSDGGYAEGREVGLQTMVKGATIDGNGDQWHHIEIGLSELFRALHWVSPPTDWAAANLQAIYFAIESTGATSTNIEIRNYHVQRRHQ